MATKLYKTLIGHSGNGYRLIKIVTICLDARCQILNVIWRYSSARYRVQRIELIKRNFDSTRSSYANSFDH
jgi:hypothetical protein